MPVLLLFQPLGFGGRLLGHSRAMRMAMIAMTTRSSMRVKAPRRRERAVTMGSSGRAAGQEGRAGRLRAAHGGLLHLSRRPVAAGSPVDSAWLFLRPQTPW